MEAIITEEEGLGLEISETQAFPMLTSLNLNDLESLMCFSRKKCKIDFLFLSLNIFLQICSSLQYKWQDSFHPLKN